MTDTAFEAREAIRSGLQHPSPFVWEVLARRYTVALPGLLQSALAGGERLCLRCARCVVVGVAELCAAEHMHQQLLMDTITVLSLGASRPHPYELAWSALDGLLRNEAFASGPALPRIAAKLCKAFQGLRKWFDDSDPRIASLLHTPLHVTIPEVETTAEMDFQGTVLQDARNKCWRAVFDNLCYAYLVSVHGVEEKEVFLDTLRALCLDMNASNELAGYIIANDAGGLGCGQIRTIVECCSWDSETQRGLPSGFSVSDTQLDAGPTVVVVGETAAGVEALLPSYRRVTLPRQVFADLDPELQADVPTRVRLVWTYDALVNTIEETRRSLQKKRDIADINKVYTLHDTAKVNTLPVTLGFDAHSLSRAEYDDLCQAELFACYKGTRGSVQAEWLSLCLGRDRCVEVPRCAVEFVGERVQDFVLAFFAAARGYVLWSFRGIGECLGDCFLGGMNLRGGLGPVMKNFKPGNSRYPGRGVIHVNAKKKPAFTVQEALYLHAAFEQTRSGHFSGMC